MRILKQICESYAEFICARLTSNEPCTFMDWALTEQGKSLLEQIGIDPELPPETSYHHETVKRDDQESINTFTMYDLTYSRYEYNHQVEAMKEMGIKVDRMTFEQCVNTLIHVIERQAIEIEALHKKENA